MYRLAEALDADVDELRLRAKKVPDGMIARIFKRPATCLLKNMNRDLKTAGIPNRYPRYHWLREPLPQTLPQLQSICVI